MKIESHGPIARADSSHTGAAVQILTVSANSKAQVSERSGLRWHCYLLCRPPSSSLFRSSGGNDRCQERLTVRAESKKKKQKNIAYTQRDLKTAIQISRKLNPKT